MKTATTIERPALIHSQGVWSIEHGKWANDGQIFINADEYGNTHKQCVAKLMFAYDKAGNDLREQNAVLLRAAPTLLSACQSALKVFEAWKHDLNSHGDLKPGESPDYDAACQMATLMQNAIDTATAQPTPNQKGE